MPILKSVQLTRETLDLQIDALYRLNQFARLLERKEDTWAARELYAGIAFRRNMLIRQAEEKGIRFNGELRRIQR